MVFAVFNNKDPEIRKDRKEASLRLNHPKFHLIKIIQQGQLFPLTITVALSSSYGTLKDELSVCTKSRQSDSVKEPTIFSLVCASLAAQRSTILCQIWRYVMVILPWVPKEALNIYQNSWTCTASQTTEFYISHLQPKLSDLLQGLYGFMNKRLI